MLVIQIFNLRNFRRIQLGKIPESRSRRSRGSGCRRLSDLRRQSLSRRWYAARKSTFGQKCRLRLARGCRASKARLWGDSKIIFKFLVWRVLLLRKNFLSVCKIQLKSKFFAFLWKKYLECDSILKVCYWKIKFHPKNGLLRYFENFTFKSCVFEFT